MRQEKHGFEQALQREDKIMKHHSSSDTCKGSCKGSCHEAHPAAWSAGEQAILRSLSLFLIRSIVESHGGSIEIDLATNTIEIDVPKEEQVPCALEIEKQLGHICL
jgi:hypothetical protein